MRQDPLTLTNEIEKENNKPETVAYFHYLTYPLKEDQTRCRLNLSHLMWSQTCYDHEIPIRQEEIPQECYAMCNFNHIRDEKLFYRNNTYSQTRNYFTATFLYSRNRKLRDLAKYHQNRKISHILPNHQACGI